MKQTFIRNKIFILTAIIILLVLLLVVLVSSKTNLHATINNINHPASDTFFKYLTHVGDGFVTAGVLLILLLFVNTNIAIGGTIGAVITSIIVQFMKRIIFTDSPRPTKFFADTTIELHIIEGVKMLQNHSFPSGHSAAAFCLFFILAYTFPKPSLKVICIVLAFLTAFSRVYLSQHFMADMVTGSFIGCSGGFLGLSIINKFQNSKLNQPLIKIIKAN